MNKEPWIGAYLSKVAKSVLVCCRCHTQVVISGFRISTVPHKFDGVPIYKCTKDTCPAFDKERNSAQREWIEYTPDYRYHKERLI